MKVKHYILLLILIDIGLISIGINYRYKDKVKSSYNTVAYRDEIDVSDAFFKFIEDNKNTISFYANTFQIEENTLITKLSEDDNFTYDINELDKYLLDFLLNLEHTNKELFDNTVKPCTDSKKYMIALIRYWTNIYTDVDFATAASIAQIESGYRAKHMLNKNNIFGGKTKDGIISYKNIEYGTLKYIRLLSTGYYGKGLNTIETIGAKYNPVYDNEGNKKANPTWVSDVTITLKNYVNYSNVVDINYLLNLKNYNDDIDNNQLF